MHELNVESYLQVGHPDVLAPRFRVTFMMGQYQENVEVQGYCGT